METKQTDLLVALQNKEQAVAIFTSEKLDTFLKEIESDALNFVADVRTAEGRKQIASKAYEISKKKVKIDEFRKELIADAKRMTSLVDQSGKKARDFLDDLRDRVREPLTLWELAESRRIQAEIDLKELTEAITEAIKEDTIFNREKEIERKEAELQKREDERLEKERIEKEKRERIEREKQIAEQAKLQTEKQMQEKIEAEKRARIESELKAELSKVEAMARHLEEIENAKIQAEIEKQNAIEKERRIVYQKEQIKAQKQLEVKAIAEQKAANLEHRRKINKEALASFVKEGIQEDTAKNVVFLIASNKIKNISINYY